MNTDLVLEALRSQWGTSRVLAVSRFGSTVAAPSHSRYADLDLAIVIDGAPSIHERDAASRALKKKLRAAGDDGLYGFNFFPATAFESIAANRSWLAVTIARAQKIVFDPAGLLAALPRAAEAVPFGWRNVTPPPAAAYERLIELHRAASAVVSGDPVAASWYSAETFRLQLLDRCRRAGLYLSRASILEAANALGGTGGNYDEVHRLNFQQSTDGEFFRDHPDHTARHLELAARLRDHGLALLGLRHAYNAARLEYLRRLHRTGYFMLDGEVTHAFLLRCGHELPPDLVGRIESVSYLAEQVLGRLGLASFDVDLEGQGIYEQLTPTCTVDESATLLDELPAIADALRSLPAGAPPAEPAASLLILTRQRAASLQRTLAAVDRLVIGQEQLEVLVVHDGETGPAPHHTRFRTSTYGKPHTGVGDSRAFGVARCRGEYLFFLDDDVVPTPTWALRLLQVAETGVALTGSTILSVPPMSLVERYCEDRELLRRPVTGSDGEIVNVITASACLRRDALRHIERPGESLARQGVRFGGDDVDLTWSILAAGLSVAHAPKAITFHQHRPSVGALIRQHVGYGHGTIVHCVERRREPASLRIAGASVRDVVMDTARYAAFEVPVRLRRALRKRRVEPLVYPFLDLLRRCAYNAGILLAAREMKNRDD
jgi:hypothetical protein